MIARVLSFSLFCLLVSSCASFTGGPGPVSQSYAPAALGPLMDLPSLRQDKLHRAM